MYYALCIINDPAYWEPDPTENMSITYSTTPVLGLPSTRKKPSIKQSSTNMPEKSALKRSPVTKKAARTPSPHYHLSPPGTPPPRHAICFGSNEAFHRVVANATVPELNGFLNYVNRQIKKFTLKTRVPDVVAAHKKNLVLWIADLTHLSTAHRMSSMIAFRDKCVNELIYKRMEQTSSSDSTNNNIEELKMELQQEKQARKNELEQEKQARKDAQEAHERMMEEMKRQLEEVKRARVMVCIYVLCTDECLLQGRTRRKNTDNRGCLHVARRSNSRMSKVMVIVFITPLRRN